MAVVAALPVAAVIGLTPLLFTEPGLLLLIGQMTVVAVSVLFSIRIDQTPPNVSDTDSKTRLVGARWKWLMTAVIGLCISAALLGDRIIEEISSGLTQRLEFWRVSASIFRSSPLVGTGLETYPAFFTSHRSLSHAVSWETVLSDSPHSVPLGILSGGGLVLAVCYAALVLTVGYFGGRAVLRAKSDSDRLFYGAVLASWIAYHVQSTVSIDMPGLIHVQWVLGGILLAGGVDADQIREFLSSRSGGNRSLPTRRRNALGRTLGSATLALLGFVLLLGPLTAPFRADLAGLRAQEAMEQADYQFAGEELLRAIELQPRNGRYAEGMALVYEESGLFELGYEQRQQAARLSRGNPGMASSAGWAAIRLNRLEEATAWFETALLAQPYGPSVVAESAWFFNHIEKPERARELLFDFEVLGVRGSPQSTPWRTVEAVYRQLGEAALADRAGTCWGRGGVPVSSGCGTLTLDDCFKGANNTLDCIGRAVDDFNASEQKRQKSDPVETVAALNFAGADFSGEDFSGEDFSGADFSGADLTLADLGQAHLRSADLSGADLSGADLSGADLTGANLIGVNLSDADLRGAILAQLDLTLTDLSGANLFEANLSGANLSGANLIGASLSRASFAGADLTDANLRKADLREAYMRHADLPEANLNEADLSMADLDGANLTGASLIGANLTGANLAGARLQQAVLISADLQGTTLGAYLVGANLSQANLAGANLAGADLTGADLSGADLNGATADGGTTWPEGFDPVAVLLAGHERSG